METENLILPIYNFKRNMIYMHLFFPMINLLLSEIKLNHGEKKMHIYHIPFKIVYWK